MQGLTGEQVAEIRESLSVCEHPLIFFDSDADGLASFLLIYRHLGKGKGVIVKTQPRLGERFRETVKNYDPDLIIVLDIALVTPEFTEGIGQKIIQIDHHGPYETKGVTYYNPRVLDKDSHMPTSYMCYQIAEDDLWIAMTGIVGDWFIGPLADRFREKYPALLPADIKTPEEALFRTDIGKLAKIFSFVLKGTTSEAMKYVKVLTRIDDPYEILQMKSAQGRFIYKKFERYNREYESLLKDALKDAKKRRSKVFLYRYGEDKNAFTSELANEIMFNYPNKVIITGRNNNGEVKCSLRAKDIDLRKILDEIFRELPGRGGGHPFACGASVAIEHFDRFMELFENKIKHQ